MIKFIFHGCQSQEEFLASWHPSFAFDNFDYVKIPSIYLSSRDDLISEIVYSFTDTNSEYTGVDLFWVWAAAAEVYFLNKDLLESLIEDNNKYLFFPFRYREEDEKFLS